MTTSTGTTTAYFLTVDELAAMGEGARGRQLIVSGVVLGDTIMDESALARMGLDLAQVPGDPQQVQRSRVLAALR